LAAGTDIFPLLFFCREADRAGTKHRGNPLRRAGSKVFKLHGISWPYNLLQIDKVYNEKRRDFRASVFTFFNSILTLKTAYFEEEIHRQVEKVEKGSKKGLERKNLFDLFDFEVKILPKIW
jgi:hypothetical protein